jgi:hypothetical protein
MLIAIAALILLGTYVVGPLTVHWTYRFAARCRPSGISLGALPEAITLLFAKRIPEIQELGFELAGCFDCGSLAPDTHSYVAYFCNRRTNDFANLSALVSPKGVSSYLEFSTHFTNGLVLETNTNSILPLSPANPDNKVFRFPGIQDARTLLQTHRQIVEKYASGLRPHAEPRGAEIERYVRAVENYGPRHSQLGYMRLAEDGEWYTLTWKGAFLMTWRCLWPVSFVRSWAHRHAMNSELHALETSDVAALQKA